VKPLSPHARAKAEAAIALLEAADCHALRNDKAAAAALNALVGMGATFRAGDPHRLRLAGITGSCTWHQGAPLLRSWRDNARRRLDGSTA